MTPDHEKTNRVVMGDDPAQEATPVRSAELPLVTPQTRYPVFSYPTFDHQTVCQRLKIVGVKWNPSYAERIDRHEESMAYWKLRIAVPFAIYVALLLGGAIEFSIYFGHLLGWNDPFTIVIIVAILGLGLYIALALPRLLGFFAGADLRFYNQVTAIFKTPNDVDVVDTMNQVGIAARRLFVLLQRSRRTWVSPPAVSDRALRLTRPLLDIELDDTLPSQQRTAVKSLLYDVTAMVVIGRPDLIPRIRAEYSSLPPRMVESSDADRDNLYLDPMRDRSRWEVVREYILPLAAWLSLAISIVAFVTASTK